MKKITLKSLLVIALAIIPMTFFAQTEGTQEKPNNNHYWYLGIDEGATLLFGDNENGKYLDNIRPELGIHGGYNFAKHFQAYLRLSAGTLRGELSNTFKIENSSFIAYDINLSADLVSLIAGYNPDRVFGLRPHVGFGQMQYQTRAIINGQQVKVGYNDEGALKGNGIGGRRVVWEIPMGIQFEFNLNRNCALYLDVMTTYTDTDRLDAYAGGKHYDWFSAGLVGFRYKFRKADPVEPTPCPEATPDCEACKDAIREAVEEALQNYQPAPVEAAAEEEEVEEVEEIVWEDKDIHLTFKVGKAEVANTQANNDEVEKVRQDLNAGRDITVVRSVGYASPEGNEDQNVKLAQARAEATSQFIQNRLGNQADGISFEAEGMGSDWDGFYAALANSNISAKDEIANQIKNSENPTATLNQLKVKYPELNDLLNSLRRTQVFVK